MILATRILKLKTGSGEVEVPVTFDVPEYNRGAWTCHFRIGWPEGPDASHGSGYDSVQAVTFAMQRAAIHLYMTKHHKSGNLYWTEPGKGYGFILPRVSRDDEAIGHDRLL